MVDLRKWAKAWKPVYAYDHALQASDWPRRL